MKNKYLLVVGDIYLCKLLVEEEVSLCPLTSQISRDKHDWYDAIFNIIEVHGGRASYNELYSDIPELLSLTEHDLSESTDGANREVRWRGTLRYRISDMVQRSLLIKEYEMFNRHLVPIFRINHLKR